MVTIIKYVFRIFPERSVFTNLESNNALPIWQAWHPSSHLIHPLFASCAAGYCKFIHTYFSPTACQLGVSIHITICRKIYTVSSSCNEFWRRRYNLFNCSFLMLDCALSGKGKYFNPYFCSKLSATLRLNNKLSRSKVKPILRLTAPSKQPSSRVYNASRYVVFTGSLHFTIQQSSLLS